MSNKKNRHIPDLFLDLPHLVDKEKIANIAGSVAISSLIIVKVFLKIGHYQTLTYVQSKVQCIYD